MRSEPRQLPAFPLAEKATPDPLIGPEHSAHAETLARLIEEHNRALHAFLMMRVRDKQEAEEVAQEAYVQILQLHEPGAVSFLRSYLFKTAANIAINRAKQRRVRDRLDQTGIVDKPVDRLTPEHRVLARQELSVFRRALFELSPKCRRAFVLHRFREWSHEDIARELGVQKRMVRHYLTQAGLYCKLRVSGLSSTEAKKQVKS